MGKGIAAWFITLSVVVGQPLALAEELPVLGQYRFLRKISVTLKGNDPTPGEFESLNQSSDPDAFIDQKIEEYLNSDEFVDLMIYRFQDWARFSGSTLPVSGERQSLGKQISNTATQVLEGVVRNDRPWNDIILGKTYTLFPNEDDRYFFKNVATLPESGTYSFEPSDNRIAGVLTTSWFWERYKASATNQNRRFSKAIFRMFLCDDLGQVAPPDGEEPYRVTLARDLVNYIRNLMGLDPVEDGSVYWRSADTHHGLLDDDDDHATEPACIACHEKLDPMGLAFGTFGTNVLDFTPKEGALYIPRESGVYEKPVTGLGGLAQALVEIPEYQSCQAKNFWRWFVGEDIPASGVEFDQLVSKVQAGQSPKEIVRTITGTRAFRLDRTQILSRKLKKPKLADVLPLLKRCDSCHESHSLKFSQLPWGGNKGAHDFWKSRVAGRLSLPDSNPKAMPANRSAWTQSELDLLKEWVASE